MLKGRIYPWEENGPRSGRVPSRRWGREEGNIQGRTLGPGQGGSQDYFTKKGARIIHIRQFDFHNVGTPFHYILLYTLYANIRRISFLCFCTLDIGKEIPQGGIWAQVRVGPGRSGVGRKEIFRGGHWARAREGPRTISPKKGVISFRSDQCHSISLLLFV